MKHLIDLEVENITKILSYNVEVIILWLTI
jgi:hypothetical protein